MNIEPQQMIDEAKQIQKRLEERFEFCMKHRYNDIADNLALFIKAFSMIEKLTLLLKNSNESNTA